MNNIQNSLNLLNDFFAENKVNFWLEAGTALAAYRDGKIFTWEHDIDVAIWRESMPVPGEFIRFFEREGYEVIFQRNYPFIDNIIQLRVKQGFQEKLFDIDIYLYSRKKGNAYMRWINKPEGKFSKQKKFILTILNCLINPKSKKWKNISSLIPNLIVKNIFKLFLKYHINNSKCIYHRFPEEYFLNLIKIDFYGFKVNIPSNTEDFLTHRYGSNWRTPDSNFNQTGKWKKSAARIELEMSLLPLPEFDQSIIYFNE